MRMSNHCKIVVRKTTFLPLLVFAFIIPIVTANTNYEFRVKLLSYENPYRTLGQASSIQCCDGGDLPTACSRNCDNKFTICFRDSSIHSETMNIATTCTHGVYNTAPVSDDDIRYSLGSTAIQLSPSSTETSTSNPIKFTGVEWPGVAQVAIEVVDADDPMGAANDQYIDTVIVDVSNLEPSTTYSPVTTYTGVRGHSNITMAFFLVCIDNYYGPGCSTICLPRDDASGHYTCDPLGGIVCRDGYTNVSSSCVQCVASQGCSSTGGYCINPGECLCRSGYSGNLCDIDLNTCGHSQPCMNGGTCTSVDNHYECSCPANYVGVNCQDNYECGPETCLNGGTCVHGECVCVEGFSGQQCKVDTGEIEINIKLIIIVATVVVIGTLIILTTIIVIVVTCIVNSKKKNRTQRMKAMTTVLKAPTDNIPLQRNPGYASIEVQGSPTNCSESSHYMNEGMGPARSASLPSSSRLATQNTQSPAAAQPTQYEHYENEGMGPKKTQKRAATMDLHPQQSIVRRITIPVLDDKNYAIPHASSTTNLIV